MTSNEWQAVRPPIIRSLPSGSRRLFCAATTTDAPPRASKMVASLTAVPRDLIDGGEIVLLAVKPSMWRPVFDSAPWLVTGFLLATVLTWLGRPVPGLSVAATGQVILLVVAARVGLNLMRWIPAWYVLTNRRVITIRGVRAPRISACLLTEVRNTYSHASPAERLARLGTINFVTDYADKVTQAWQSIPRPDEVHARIRRAIEDAFDQQA